MHSSTRTCHGLLDRDSIEQFTCEGYVILPDLFTAAEVARCSSELSRLFSECDAAGRHRVHGAAVQFEMGSVPQEPGERELQVRKFLDFAQADAFFWDHCRDARLLRAVESVIGPSVQLLQSMALVKPPGIGSAKDWHQDIPYFAITPKDQACGIWIALDHADEDNGCMQVIPRSHLAGVHPHIDGPTGFRIAPETIDSRIHEVRALPMAAGSALLFSTALWHFTDHNRSRRRRRAVQYHYVSALTTSAPGLHLYPLTSGKPPVG